MFLWQLRVPALSLYGFLAASSVLGIKGVSVVLVHLGLNFSVAKLRKPALSWLCSLLLLLSTLHIQPLQEIQVGSPRRCLEIKNLNKIRIKLQENRPCAAILDVVFERGELLLGVILVKDARRRSRWREVLCCSCICRKLEQTKTKKVQLQNHSMRMKVVDGTKYQRTSRFRHCIWFDINEQQCT